MSLFSGDHREVRVDVPPGAQVYLVDARMRVTIIVGLVLTGLLLFAVGLAIGSRTADEDVTTSRLEREGRNGEPEQKPIQRQAFQVEGSEPALSPAISAPPTTSSSPGHVRSLREVLSKANSSTLDRPFTFEAAADPPQTPYGELIYRAARRASLDPDLVAAIVAVESNFDRWAISIKGARGLMQIMPSTAAGFGIDADELFDPTTNLAVGTAFLRELGHRFEGNLELTLAAYNSGPNAVDSYEGVPPYRETQAYVRLVSEAFKELERTR